MPNIEFSELNQLILENQELANYVSYRIATMNDEEAEAGQIIIDLDTGDSLTISFPATKNLSKLALV